MPWQAELLLNTIGPDTETRARQRTAMTPKHKLMIALRFYASNGFYYFVGDGQGYGKHAIHYAILQVTVAVNRRLFAQLIQWPTTEVECQQIELDFYRSQDVGIAGICGAIDGSLISINPPRDFERFYLNRHHDHSLNLTVVADSNYVLRYVNASYPGSVSDARVLHRSSLAMRFDEGWRPFPGAFLFGNSIYPLKDWLIPIREHPSTDEEHFYRGHAKLRRVVECTFGILKKRFYCLGTRIGVRQPLYASQIIKACCALHNFLLLNREPNDPYLIVCDDEDE